MSETDGLSILQEWHMGGVSVTSQWIISLSYARTPGAPAHRNLIYLIKYPCKGEYLNKGEKLRAR
jgi:hypothetical protein